MFSDVLACWYPVINPLYMVANINLSEVNDEQKDNPFSSRHYNWANSFSGTAFRYKCPIAGVIKYVCQ